MQPKQMKSTFILVNDRTDILPRVTEMMNLLRYMETAI